MHYITQWKVQGYNQQLKKNFYLCLQVVILM